MFFLFLICLHSATLAQPNPIARQQRTTTLIPLVGCKSDGQTGPVDAPTGKDHPVAVSPLLAQRLAYYKSAYGIGVLAPRNWNCFGAYGSNGISLYVSPTPLSSNLILSTDWKGLTGPAIQLSIAFGDTSGRFEVARTIARIFPARTAFVKRVIAEGIAPASSFPSGPFPTDKLTYPSHELVEFQTPADTQGMGTESRLMADDFPIRGAALLAGKAPNLVTIFVRLAQADDGIAEAIIHEAEKEGSVPSP